MDEQSTPPTPQADNNNETNQTGDETQTLQKAKPNSNHHSGDHASLSLDTAIDAEGAGSGSLTYAEPLKPHIQWRFLVLSAALGLCLIGGGCSLVPAESRTAALTLAGTIISAMAKPLEGMDP
jgi:hypothetical protein